MKRARDFINRIQSSPELQAAQSDASWSVSSVVKVGASEGYDFTGEEYRAAYGELAREELAAVVGGVSAAWKKAADVDREPASASPVGADSAG
ncbi:MAG: Nif11 family protein [Nannocystaceae bacterium]